MRAVQYYLGRANTSYCSLYRDGGGLLGALLQVLALAPQAESVVNFSWKPNSARMTARVGARDQATMGRFYERVGNAIAEYPIPRHAKFPKARKVLQHPATRIEFRPCQTAGEGRLGGAQRPLAPVAASSMVSATRRAKPTLSSAASGSAFSRLPISRLVRSHSSSPVRRNKSRD